MDISEIFGEPASEPVAATPKKPKAAPATDDPVAAGEARVSEAARVYAKCEAVLNALMLRVADAGENLGSEIDDAEDKRFAAERALKLAQRAAEAARQTAKEKALQAERDDAAAKWEKAIALANARATVAKALHRDLKAFAQSWTQFVDLNNQLFDAIPVKLDPDAAKLRIPGVVGMVRVELTRHGATWASDISASVLSNFPAMDEALAETPAVIRGWRDQMTSWAEHTKAEV